MRATRQATDRHYADTDDQVPEKGETPEERRETTSIDRVLQVVNGMAVWGGDSDYELYRIRK